MNIVLKTAFRALATAALFTAALVALLLLMEWIGAC